MLRVLWISPLSRFHIVFLYNIILGQVCMISYADHKILRTICVLKRCESVRSCCFRQELLQQQIPMASEALLGSARHVRLWWFLRCWRAAKHHPPVITTQNAAMSYTTLIFIQVIHIWNDQKTARAIEVITCNYSTWNHSVPHFKTTFHFARCLLWIGLIG